MAYDLTLQEALQKAHVKVCVKLQAALGSAHPEGFGRLACRCRDSPICAPVKISEVFPPVPVLLKLYSRHGKFLATKSLIRSLEAGGQRCPRRDGGGLRHGPATRLSADDERVR